MSSRKEIMEWLDTNNIEYSDTATVAQLKRLRNDEIIRLRITNPEHTEAIPNWSDLCDDDDNGAERPPVSTEQGQPPCNYTPLYATVPFSSETIGTSNIAASIVASMISATATTDTNTTTSNSFPTITHSTNSDPQNKRAQLEAESELLELEIRLIRQRKLLAELRGDNNPVVNTDTNTNRRITNNQPTYHDIKRSVFLFSNTTEYDANKWIMDYENACDSVHGDDAFRFKCVRRFMKEDTDADLFLRTDHSTSYAEFKENFLANFGHRYTLDDIMERMK